MKTDEQILIGDDIRITLVKVRGNSVRLGIDAPKNIRVVRGELMRLENAELPDPVVGEEYSRVRNHSTNTQQQSDI